MCIGTVCIGTVCYKDTDTVLQKSYAVIVFGGGGGGGGNACRILPSEIYM